MTLDELRAFLTVAETGSFTKASARLNRSQPAVSRRIDQLESGLGTPLFARRGRHIALTEAGRSLLSHAEAALGAVEDGRRAVRDVAAGTEDRLTLAVVGTIADSYLVEALRAFQAAFADVQVDLQTANSKEVGSLVRRGDAIIGLRYFTDAGPGLSARLLGTERLYVVLAADHPVRATRTMDLTPFSGDRWLSFPPTPGVRFAENRHSYADILDSELAAGGIDAPQRTIVDSLTAQKRLVEAGFGVALMPKRNVRDEIAGGSLRIVEVASLTARLPLYMIRRRGGPRSATLDAFAEHLRDHIPRMLDG